MYSELPEINNVKLINRFIITVGYELFLSLCSGMGMIPIRLKPANSDSK